MDFHLLSLPTLNGPQCHREEEEKKKIQNFIHKKGKPNLYMNVKGAIFEQVEDVRRSPNRVQVQ